MQQVRREAKPERQQGEQVKVEAVVEFFEVPENGGLKFPLPMADLVVDGPVQGSSSGAASLDRIVPMPRFGVAPLGAVLLSASEPGAAEATDLGDGPVSRFRAPRLGNQAGDGGEDLPGKR